jgi:hypothetical protein
MEMDTPKRAITCQEQPSDRHPAVKAHRTHPTVPESPAGPDGLGLQLVGEGHKLVQPRATTGADLADDQSGYAYLHDMASVPGRRWWET